MRRTIDHRLPTVIFDLDGTLVDTAPGLVARLNSILCRAGQAPVLLEEARSVAGEGVAALIRHACARNCVSMPPEQEARLVEQFFQEYSADPDAWGMPFPGIPTLLRALTIRGVRLVVATNKHTWLAERLLEKVSIREHFTAVAGHDVVSQRKPSAAHLLEALAMGGGQRDMAIVVGDRLEDVEAALAARIPCIFFDPLGQHERDADVGLVPIARTCERLANLLDDAFAVLTANNRKRRAGRPRAGRRCENHHGPIRTG